MTSLRHPTGPTAPFPSVLGHHISHTVIIRQTLKHLSSIQQVQPTQQVQPLRPLAPCLPLHTSTRTQPPQPLNRDESHTPPTRAPHFFRFVLLLPSFLGIRSLGRRRICVLWFGGFAPINRGVEAANQFVWGDICQAHCIQRISFNRRLTHSTHEGVRYDSWMIASSGK
jgi:hypothetical protein